MKIIIIFLGLIFSSFNLQASNAICTDLANLTCSEKVFDDGTWSDDGVQPEKIQSIVKYQKKRAGSHFLKELNDGKNKDFLIQAVSATGLSAHPDCQTTNDNYSDACKNEVANLLGDQIVKATYGPFAQNSARTVFGSGILPDIIFITEHPVWKSSMDKLQAEFSNALKNKSIEDKIKNKIFPTVRDKIIQKINSSKNIDEDTKQKMIKKIKLIRFDGSQCNFDGSKTQVAHYLIPNAFYHPFGNRFVLCNGLTIYNKSEFFLAHVIAHELSHAIDPCVISMWTSDLKFHYSHNSDRKTKEKEYPYSNVITCLREGDSVHAKPHHNDTEGEKYNFCDGNEQIGESFSDWMAAEVLPEYIEEKHSHLTKRQKQLGYGNVFKSFNCEPSVKMGFSFGGSDHGRHPKAKDRVNKIVSVQPKIRKHLGCDEKHPRYRYCDENIDVVKEKEAAEKGEFENKSNTDGRNIRLKQKRRGGEK